MTSDNLQFQEPNESLTITDADSLVLSDTGASLSLASLTPNYTSGLEVRADNPAFGTLGSRAAFINALDAAEARGKYTIVRIPAGMVIDVLNGLSLSGYSVQIHGDGAGVGAGSTPNGSVIKASTQTGPVLDFTGYVLPSSAMGRITPLSGVFIQGSNVADATKNNAGIRLLAMGSALFCDIAIANTGGPCLELKSNPGSGVYLSDFERITLNTPVSAKANDVPYFVADEPNGNRFRGIGFRSITGSADCGVSGAARITGNASFTPHDNLFDSWWYEFLHVPTNGALFHIEGSANIISDFQFFDIAKEAAATNTSYFRLAVPVSENFGGNSITGQIPGRGTGAVNVDTGVTVLQDRNRIVGVKGYKGHNVTIASGVSNTYVNLAGAYSGATTAGVDDNSGNLTNTYIDEYLGTISRMGVVPPVRTTDVQVFTATGTWTKPTGAQFVDVSCIAGGGGGGSGRRGAAGSVRSGGSGGGGAGSSAHRIPASILGATVAVTIGAAGAGGTAITANDTDGNAGTGGAATTFGTLVRSGAPTGGSGGTASAGTGGSAGNGAHLGTAGGAAAAAGAAGANSATSAASGGGGGGGGISSGNAASAGGNGGASNSATASSGAGGVIDSTQPGSGTAITTGSGVPGSGGGGGASSITTVGQTGAAGGIYGGGGGGGGASVNGNNSGAGGIGGAGICIVVTYF